jgi:hypothetical protein
VPTNKSRRNFLIQMVRTHMRSRVTPVFLGDYCPLQFLQRNRSAVRIPSCMRRPHILHMSSRIDLQI